MEGGELHTNRSEAIMKRVSKSLVVLSALVGGLTMAVYVPSVSAIDLEVLGTFDGGGFGAAESVAYDSKNEQLFISNGREDRVDIVDISGSPGSVTDPVSVGMLELPDAPTSVAVHGDLVAVAVPADPATDPGTVLFFNTEGTFINEVEVGALPDMLIFTPNGRQVLVANEGEPSDDYSTDPEGSVSIIDVKRGADRATVTAVDFTAFNGQAVQLRDDGDLWTRSDRRTGSGTGVYYRQSQFQNCLGHAAGKQRDCHH